LSFRCSSAGDFGSISLSNTAVAQKEDLIFDSTFATGVVGSFLGSHPITEDYGLPKPAPRPALPVIISVIETPRVFYSPLRPLRSPARRNLTVLTSLTPPAGAGAVVIRNAWSLLRTAPHNRHPRGHASILRDVLSNVI
jgi:hypothetical protein